MAIVRFNDPFSGLTSLHSQLDDMFSDFLSTAPAAQKAPAMDIYTEDDKQLVAEAHVPGFDRDDIEVNVHDGMLEIRGEKHEKEEQKATKKRNYMLRESHASFYRNVLLPKNADTDNVQADFEKGILKITVPFRELPKPKKITISADKKS